MIDALGRPPLDDVLDALVDVGRPLLLTRFHQRCCVAATRLATRVLDECGYAARPRRVWVRAGNAAFVEAVERQIPGDDHELVRLGVRFIEIADDTDAPPATEKDINAHYVANAAGLLIDLSAGQLNRPAKKIHVPGAVIIDATDPENMGMDLDGGGILVYRWMDGVPPNRGDWRPERTGDLAREVIATIHGGRC